MPSIEDVARATGVSTATVSRALRGLGSVAEPTRARVLSVARELGYVPSAAAVSLASGRTRAVGLVTPSVSRWFFAECIETIGGELRERGLDVLLVILPPTDWEAPSRTDAAGGVGLPPARPRLTVDLLRKRVDATVVLCLPLDGGELAALRGLGQPLVSLGTSPPGVPSVGIDDTLVGRVAAEHLLALGHRRIGFAGAPLGSHAWAPTRRRYEGHCTALRAAGVQPLPPLPSDLTVDAGRSVGRDLLARRARGEPLPTALVCASDELAIGLVHELRGAGVAVPGEVSVVGVDGHPHAELHGLTTVSQPVARQAAVVARCVVESFAAASGAAVAPGGGSSSAGDGCSVLLPTTLVVRTSTAPPRDDR